MCPEKHENMDPEQIISLLMASSERYQTFSAKMHIKGFRYKDDPNKPELVQVLEVLWRSAGDKSYYKIDRTSYEPVKGLDFDLPRKTVKTYSINSQQSKVLLLEREIHRGQIAPDHRLEKSHGVLTVKDAMWDYFTWPLEEVDREASSVVFDKETDQYVATFKMGSSEKGPYVKLYIAPSQGYIPVKKQFIKYDGSLIITLENNNFILNKEGLWIPLKYTDVFEPKNHSAIHEVQEITINEPIADELFELSFPIGTFVTDHSSGKRYRVEP